MKEGGEKRGGRPTWRSSGGGSPLLVARGGLLDWGGVSSPGDLLAGGGGRVGGPTAGARRRTMARKFLSMLVVNVHTKDSQSSELIKIRFLFS